MNYTIQGDNWRQLCPKCNSKNVEIKDNREDRDFGNMDLDATCKDCGWRGYCYDES